MAGTDFPETAGVGLQERAQVPINFLVEGTEQTTKGGAGLCMPVSLSKLPIRSSLSSLGMTEEAGRVCSQSAFHREGDIRNQEESIPLTPTTVPGV